MGDQLPDLPLDDAALDLYWSALHPEPGAERSSIGDLLDLYSEMAGSDPNAVAERLDDQTVFMRDAFYHPNDLLSALIIEVRRLRQDADTLADRLRSAYAVIKRLQAGFNPAILDRIHEALEAHQKASAIGGCAPE